MKAKQFLRLLKYQEIQVSKARGKGGHYRLTSTIGRSVLSVHGATDLSPEYMKDICKQLGLDLREVLRCDTPMN